jgi:effector-binding domain-containing protein
MDRPDLRVSRGLARFAVAFALWSLPAAAETTAQPSTPAAGSPAQPSAKTAPSATPTAPAAPSTSGGVSPSAPKTDSPAAGKPTTEEYEPHGSPGVPDNATTESVDVPARTVVMTTGNSTYEDAFKSIKASLETVKRGLDKAGLKASGHPLTIFSEPGDKSFKYQLAIPVAGTPDPKLNLGAGLSIGQSPAGKAIKFQHRGGYDDIDSTYDVITAYLDAKGLQVRNPYIEEYLTDLTTSDDPNLQVDIYVFVK